MIHFAWMIPLFPLASFVVLLLFGQRWKNGAAYTGILFTFVSFVTAVIAWLEQVGGTVAGAEIDWLVIGDTVLTMGFAVQPLNALMLVIVALVSFLVHVYSKGYMADDPRIGIFFAYLGLFTFSMLALVISPNLLQFYIFWELVGVCSFLLIGFYFGKSEAKAAAKKAFIVTRVGDVALFIGIILLFWQTGSFAFDDIFRALEKGAVAPEMITLTAVLIFTGAVGKSGQFPLHTWLPDAMEGPTPVSALIHAATMVAAGVYLVAAMYPLYLASSAAMMTVAVVGGFTAIFAASIGLVQKDIKRILAYSTVSQLGYMMLALGVGGYVAGVFHLMTHAFFKALLFLAAGSVIHAVHTQNIENMGGLWRKMRRTGPLFLIGSLAISGVPLLSGFFSKDEILLAAVEEGHWLLFLLALIAAFFTAFYMFRLFFLVFFGEPKRTASDIHESPFSMAMPMALLGVLAVLGGYVNTAWFGTFLADWLATSPVALGIEESGGSPWVSLAVTVVATLTSLGGIYLAWLIYEKGTVPRDWLSKKIPFGHRVLYRKYYIDELYRHTVVRGTSGFSRFLSFFDSFVIDGLVQFSAAVTQAVGGAGRRLQTGRVQTYGAAAFVGLVVVIVIIAVTGGYFR
ncbi:MAG TPA: NADH-quinone oxidoreductase subunit L [Bacillales bacterium]|nr:NADH-quinone oxidoreductase subunit L [Bacillales bacterium]